MLFFPFRSPCYVNFLLVSQGKYLAFFKRKNQGNVVCWDH
uniref:Uncharacterized protein n=1 Tax=Arundo donax TaxID=35708 RepID=A0A0A9A3P7_ARUDO